VSPGNRNDKPGTGGPAGGAGSGKDASPPRPAIPRSPSLKFEAPKPPPGYRPDPDPNAAATITADISSIGPAAPPEPVHTPEATPIGPPLFDAPNSPEPTPAPRGNVPPPGFSSEPTPAPRENLLPLGFSPEPYPAPKPPPAYEPAVGPWKTSVPGLPPTPAVGFSPTTQKMPEPAARPSAARDVTAKLDLLAERAAAAARGLNPAQKKALAVLSGMAALFILVLVFGTSSLRAKPTERELWMAYPYGKQGATGAHGERAPAADEVEYRVLEEVQCSNPSFDRCLLYRYARDDFAGTMLVGKRHGGIWERLSDEGMPFRILQK
jgi:hypothetical protein